MTIVEAIFNVFTEVGDWIVAAFNQMIPIFWNTTDNTLTVMGTLGVIALGINVILLFLGIVQRFLKFRA